MKDEKKYWESSRELDMSKQNYFCIFQFLLYGYGSPKAIVFMFVVFWVITMMTTTDHGNLTDFFTDWVDERTGDDGKKIC